MEKSFIYLHQTRQNILSLYEKHEEKAFFIPKGFRNHLFWNLAHCIVTQQILCYKLSGNPMLIDNEFVEKYKKGTFPSLELVSQTEVSKTKELLFTTIELMREDYRLGLFSDFKEYPTSYGIKLTSFDDAIRFNNIHESLHLGYMMALVK